MRHDSKGKTRDIISMEEYLKKRQAINPTEHTKKEGLGGKPLRGLSLSP